MMAGSFEPTADDADLARPCTSVDHRRRDELAGGLELAGQAIQVVLPVLRPLAVTGIFVVAGAAGEVGRRAVRRARQRAIGDAIAVHILVAAPRAAQLA